LNSFIFNSLYTGHRGGLVSITGQSVWACGGKSETETGFSTSTLGFPYQCDSPYVRPSLG